MTFFRVLIGIPLFVLIFSLFWLIVALLSVKEWLMTHRWDGWKETCQRFHQIFF